MQNILKKDIFDMYLFCNTRCLQREYYHLSAVWKADLSFMQQCFCLTTQSSAYIINASRSCCMFYVLCCLEPTPRFMSSAGLVMPSSHLHNHETADLTVPLISTHEINLEFYLTRQIHAHNRNWLLQFYNCRSANLAYMK